MSAYYAVEGCELECSSGTATLTITTAPSAKVKFGGKAAYMGDLSVTISGYLGGSITNGDGVGSAVISGSSVNKVEGAACVLEGDESAQVTVTGTNSGGSAASAVITVKVSAAGQSVCKGN